MSFYFVVPEQRYDILFNLYVTFYLIFYFLFYSQYMIQRCTIHA